MNTIPSDFTCAFRQIARHRAFSATVIVTLALGIGATTTFFSILNALTFRPLAFPDSDRLVAVRTFERPQTTSSEASYSSVLDVAKSRPALRSAVAFTSRDVNAAGAEGAERSLRSAVSGDLFDLLGASFSTFDDVHAWYVRDRTLQGLVLGSLGLVALVLAALGVHPVMALLVSHERREFAIRIALGSSNQAVQRLVLGRSLRVAAGGIVAGLILASVTTSLLSRIFFGVRPFDPRIMMGAALLLAATALFASWWPARRAMKLDPMAVLRT